MADEKIYMPKQKVRAGKAGYKGKNIVIVADPRAAAEAKATGKKS